MVVQAMTHLHLGRNSAKNQALHAFQRRTDLWDIGRFWISPRTVAEHKKIFQVCAGARNSKYTVVFFFIFGKFCTEWHLIT